MGLLVKTFRKKVEKDPKQQEAVFDVGYSTGFLALDFANGACIRTIRGDSYYSVGLIDGTAVTFIGRPGCGKTTLVNQIAANIVRPFPNAAIFYDDIEGGSNGGRRQTLMRFGIEELEERVIYRNAGITAENVYSRLYDIYEEKMTNHSEYEYDTGLFDPNGNRIFKLEPTVYIIDSLAMLTPGKLTEEEELSGQMSATAMARTNTSVYKRIVPLIKAANIILLVINHINDKVDINSFAKTQALVSWLKQGETLPGGKAAIYLANNMFRLDDNTKLKASEGMGVYGTIVDVSLVKSRTNASGKAVPMVLDYMNGFDPELSLLIFLKNVGEVNAKGAYMSMLDYPNIKFTQKAFKEKLVTDPEFKEAFEASCAKRLRELVPAPTEIDQEHSVENLNLSSSILKMVQP